MKLREFRKWLGQMSPMARFHFWAAVFWGVALLPTLIWWRDSILWVLVISLWANIASHWSCFQAARAEEKASETLDKKCEDR